MSGSKEAASLCDGAKWRRLAEIMSTLRGPEGCPWDKAQDHDSLKKYLLEETYEVLDAIDRKNDDSLRDELGDVLLQVVFHAQLARERGAFTLDGVVDGVCEKMVRRHPHIFGSAQAEDADAVLTMWESIKAREGNGRGGKRGLMQVNDNLPALMLAQKVQDKAHRVGFDWEDRQGSWDKVYEELDELRAAADPEQARDELGDVLFAVTNLARFYDLDAEQALRHTDQKFISRCNYIEARLDEQGISWADCSREKLNQLWLEAKEREREK